MKDDFPWVEVGGGGRKVGRDDCGRWDTVSKVLGNRVQMIWRRNQLPDTQIKHPTRPNNGSE